MIDQLRTALQPMNAWIAVALDSMPGWCTPAKARAMAELILETEPDVVVEIGVFGGRSLLTQAMAAQLVGHGRVYGIDPWRREACLEGKNDPANDAWWSSINIEDIQRQCVDAIWRYNLQHHAIVLRAHSADVADLFPIIDILHIDGAHSELASVRDVTNYLPRVRPGGHIWFDDTDWATTARAVAMVAEQCEPIKDVGACRLFRKR